MRGFVNLKTFALCFVLISPVLRGDPGVVSLSNLTAAPGSSVVFPVILQSNGNSISGIQFDIQYDNTAIGIFATLGDAAKNTGKLLYQVDLTPNTRRFLIVGLNSNLIWNGTLLSLFVNLSPSTSTGLFPLAVSNVIGTDPTGLPASVEGSDGAINVAGGLAQTVALQIAGVLNGAGLVSGPLAPGEIFTLIGSNIGSTGTHVSFDGISATLFYVGANQINGIAPYELTGRALTDLEITAADRLISDVSVPVAAESPAIFTLDGSGVGQGAILNQDLTVNSTSNPALRGTIVALYATGFGQTNPASINGQIGGAISLPPASPIAVQIGGIGADVLFAGTASGLTTGVLQVNCRIPLATPPGYSASIVLTVGGHTSSPNVTLAVQ